MGILGNERTDHIAATVVTRGNTGKDSEMATYEGMREKGKEWRKSLKTLVSFVKQCTEWGRHAVAAYTRTSTNRGPQKAWLPHIGKSGDPSCPCGHPSQDGGHLAFHCPLLREQRARLLSGERTWESLDDPPWVAEAKGNGRE